MGGAAQELLGQQPDIAADRPAIDELRVRAMENFNTQQNLFPISVSLYTYGADADANLSGEIEAGETRAFVPNRLDDPTAAYVGNLAHNILLHVSNVNITENVGATGPLRGFKTIEPIRIEEAQLNDLLITDNSSQHPNQIQHIGPRVGTREQWLLRNHRNIKDPDTMERILSTIRRDFPLK